MGEVERSARGVGEEREALKVAFSCSHKRETEKDEISRSISAKDFLSNKFAQSENTFLERNRGSRIRFARELQSPYRTDVPFVALGVFARMHSGAKRSGKLFEEKKENLLHGCSKRINVIFAVVAHSSPIRN